MLPAFAAREKPAAPVQHVGDTIEGWTDVLHALLENVTVSRHVEFNYLHI